MIAERLHEGDKIGLISPACTVTKNMRQGFQDGCSLLEALGFQVEAGDYIFSHTLRYSATPEEKALDINKFFGDPSIWMLLTTQGGVTTNACLDYLDWNEIKKNPKILMGSGDLTVLLNAVFAKTGLITFHGPNLIHGFGNNPSSYDIREFKKRLILNEKLKIEKKSHWKVIRPGQTSGQLLGGNLLSFIKLIGTDYMPDVSNAILFFEAANITPEYAHCYFHHLKQLGVFRQINGVIIGYNYNLEEKAYLEQLENTLYYVTREDDFPILKIHEFGYNCPNTIIPVGAGIRLDTKESMITFIHSPVR